MMTTPIAQMSVEMAKVSIAMQKGTKATQVLKVAQVKLLQTALGPVYDLFLDMKRTSQYPILVRYQGMKYSTMKR